MPCYLRLSGNFDPDDLRDAAPCAFDVRYRQGDTDRKGHIHNEALIQFTASAADFDNLDEQFQDTVRFVERYGRELEIFCQRPEFTTLVFDFGFPYDPKFPAFWRTIPRKVVEAAATCSAAIEMSFYSTARFDETKQ